VYLQSHNHTKVAIIFITLPDGKELLYEKREYPNMESYPAVCGDDVAPIYSTWHWTDGVIRDHSPAMHGKNRLHSWKEAYMDISL
jgi:hypothetical protein